MKFNLTLLEFALFTSVRPAVYIWTKYGRRLRRWLYDYFSQRCGPRNLKSGRPLTPSHYQANRSEPTN